MSDRKAEPVARLSAEIMEDRMEQLKQLFPEAVNEDGIDIDVLANLLGRKEERKERFNFTWAGKQDAILGLQNRSRATLKPVPEESVNWDSTGHVFIEGDNLEVMKLLYKSYCGRVKMIYIDPPYNTGNDFVYPDNYAEPLANYLQLTGQVDEEGNLQTSAVDRAGRRHSGWLSMMYPRLFLARQLLREDGVIFVSIDDNEVHSLRMLMDEVFGEEHFIANFVWHSTKSITNPALVSVSHTHNLVYAKSLNEIKKNRVDFKLPAILDGFANPDNDPRGPWKADPFEAGGERPNQMYPIKNPNTDEIFYPRNGNCWKNDLARFKELLEENRIVFGVSGKSRPQRKRFLAEAQQRGLTANTWWRDAGTTTSGTNELTKILGDNIFPHPKPVKLICKMLQLATTPTSLQNTESNKSEIVLDFFAGSATTAHAVLEQNCKDCVDRRFIMVQLPEPMQHQQFKNVTEVGKERIRRVIQQMQLESKETEDLGFRVFRLDQSPLRQWQELSARNTGADDYAAQMELFVNDPLLDGWTVADVIAEVAIKESGFSLSYRYQRVAAVTGQSVFRVVDDERGQYFYICLDEELSFDALGPLKLGAEDLFIFRDCAASDTLVANLALTCRIRSI